MPVISHTILFQSTSSERLSVLCRNSVSTTWPDTCWRLRAPVETLHIAMTNNCNADISFAKCFHTAAEKQTIDEDLESRDCERCQDFSMTIAPFIFISLALPIASRIYAFLIFLHRFVFICFRLCNCVLWSCWTSALFYFFFSSVLFRFCLRFFSGKREKSFSIHFTLFLVFARVFVWVNVYKTVHSSGMCHWKMCGIFVFVVRLYVMVSLPDSHWMEALETNLLSPFFICTSISRLMHHLMKTLEFRIECHRAGMTSVCNVQKNDVCRLIFTENIFWWRTDYRTTRRYTFNHERQNEEEKKNTSICGIHSCTGAHILFVLHLRFQCHPTDCDWRIARHISLFLFRTYGEMNRSWRFFYASRRFVCLFFIAQPEYASFIRFQEFPSEEWDNVVNGRGWINYHLREKFISIGCVCVSENRKSALSLVGVTWNETTRESLSRPRLSPSQYFIQPCRAVEWIHAVRHHQNKRWALGKYYDTRASVLNCSFSRLNRWVATQLFRNHFLARERARTRRIPNKLTFYLNKFCEIHILFECVGMRIAKNGRHNRKIDESFN